MTRAAPMAPGTPNRSPPEERGQACFTLNLFYHLAGLVLAYHVVAASVLLNGGATLGTLLGVSGYPVASFAVVVTLLDPLLDQVTPTEDQR